MNAPSFNQKPSSLFTDNLIAVGKLDYAKGTRPKVDCIFCAVKNNDPNVTALKVYQDDDFMICLNLYPYNPGHLMVIPTRHVESFELLEKNERDRMFQMTLICQKILRDLFSPTGFNVGYNEGKYSGASIEHIHIHIVPRYQAELGFIDIIGKTKIIIQPASEVLHKLKSYIKEFNPFHR